MDACAELSGVSHYGGLCCITLCVAVLQVLRKARIVGMTTSGVAIMQKLITALQPKVLVVEEAEELFEANLLACLGPQTEHIILIGEHTLLLPLQVAA